MGVKSLDQADINLLLDMLFMILNPMTELQAQ